jgi:hypothetical protein
MSRTRWNVAPRYTPGSPAQVDEEIADRVWAQERESYEAALTGIYGTERYDLARRVGLAWVVYLVYENGTHLYREDRATRVVEEITTLGRCKPGDQFTDERGGRYRVSTWGARHPRAEVTLWVEDVATGQPAKRDRYMRVYRLATERHAVLPEETI